MSHLPTQPLIIQFSDIVFGDRERSTYSGIEDLADSIEQQGLEVPIILSPLPDGKFLLEAGGRRYRALELLGATELYHAFTCVPGKPGFLLKGAASSDEDRFLTELIENQFREDFDWRDEVRLLVKAFRTSQREASKEGRKIYYHTFGKMVGVGYADVQAAVAIHDELIINPEIFASSNTLLQAYKVLLDLNRKAAAQELASRVITKEKIPEPLPYVRADSQPELVQAGGEFIYEANQFRADEPRPVPSVHLSHHFICGDSLDHLAGIFGLYDHIICDPDFAVDVERLEANNAGAFATGVAQDSVGASLDVLKRLMPLAFQAIRSTGYFIFWYDLDHHEKLQAWAVAAGFAVQRWPLIWHKVDYRSNASPSTNFTKNVEYAMVCRKPGSTLAVYPQLSVFSLPAGQTTKDFGHPFAKPIDLWTKLFTAVAHKGQKVFDPFMGSASSCIAALRYGLQPYGCELQQDHYNTALLNLQKEYRRLLGPDVLFS